MNCTRQYRIGVYYQGYTATYKAVDVPHLFGVAHGLSFKNTVAEESKPRYINHTKTDQFHPVRKRIT
jgi:hypothetical protein